MPRRSEFKNGFECPHCGEWVAASAVKCRACGASDEYGWGEQELLETDYGEDDFDYDHFIAREFPADAQDGSPAMSRKMWAAWIIIALIVAMIISAL